MASSIGNKRAEGMIFVKEGNMILEEALGTRMLDDPPKREACDICVADFDGVKFRVLVTPERPSYVSVHCSLGPKVGAKIKGEMRGAEILEATYPGMVVEPEPGYDFAVGLDLDSLGSMAPEAKAGLHKRLGAMRRHLLGAPVITALQGLRDGNGGSLPCAHLPTRPGEGLWVKPGNDRCTFIFALNFCDETDNALARVMLQQLAKESAKVNGAPPCNFSEAKNPPLEIRDQGGLTAYSGSAGFLSFVVFPAHVSSPPKFEKTAILITTFRNYLHYHIKASKTYLHMRMRRKVSEWLQVLNRSHHETRAGQKEKTTASGRTFRRAGAASS